MHDRPIARIARRATALAEAWMPDAFVFALGATVLAAVAAVGVDPTVRAAPVRLVRAWGDGFWTLIPFTLQMSMIVVGGYLLASAPPIRRIVRAVAGLARTDRGAVVLVALCSMGTSLLNWGFSLIFSSLLAREVARRRPDADYRALAASAFLGLGTVWAQGLSGSAALQMASVGSMPKALVDLVGAPIPLTETIFRWQSLACVAIEVAVVTLVMHRAVPEHGQGAAALGIDLTDAGDAPLPPPRTPGERLEHSPWLLGAVCCVGVVYLVDRLAGKATTVAGALNAIDFNTINLFFLVSAGLLHRTPASLVRALKEATPAVAGILLQFPFYAGIFGIMTGTTLGHGIAALFVRASSAALYPAFVVLYSAVLGMFVPSGGSKWVIEAPYVLQAARELGVSDGWMVVTYDLGEAIANLCQPFWMLPTLALLGLRAREIMGYTFLVAAVLVPLVTVLVVVLAP